MKPKPIAICALASSTILILATTVSGAVLTSQPPVSGGGISRWSQLWQDPFGDNDLDGDSICWTDFNASSAVSINHIEWWGEGACELGFQLEFWPQDPGTIAYQPLAVFSVGPGPSPVIPQARFVVTPSDYTISSGPGGISHFALDLTNPVTLGANSPTNPRWFVGIIGFTHQAFINWNWSQTSVVGPRTYQWVRGGFDGGGYAFRSLGEGRALVLEEIVQLPPQLDVAFLDGQIEVRWSASQLDYNLESSPGLSPPNWSVVTNDVVMMDEQFFVLLDTTESNAFFRLRKVAP